MTCFSAGEGDLEPAPQQPEMRTGSRRATAS